MRLLGLCSANKKTAMETSMFQVKAPSNGSETRRHLGFAFSIVCLIALSLAPAALYGRQRQDRRTAVPPRLTKAVGCLVAADYVRRYDLRWIGLKVGDIGWVRYRIGSIPGIGGTPGLWHVIVYSRDSQRGVLLLADPNRRGGFVAIRNGYRLTKRNSRWSASYGNGGFRDYEAIGRYVTALSRLPRYRVPLVPGGSECTLDK